MRILLIHNFYQIKGGEDHSILIEEKILDEEHEVKTYYACSSEINKMKFLSKTRLFTHMYKNKKTVKELTEIISSFKPHVAIIQNVFPIISPYVYVLLHSKGIPIIQVIRNFRFFCANGLFHDGKRNCELCAGGRWMPAILKRCYRRSFSQSIIMARLISRLKKKDAIHQKISVFLVLNNFVANKVKSYGIDESKIVVRPNFFSLKSFNGKIVYNPYFVYIGLIHKSKGIRILIEAFEKARLPDNFCLYIAGTGSDVSYIKEKQKNNKNIIYKGYVTGNDKYDLISRATGLIYPSLWYENFPRSILEAYSFSKPVIATKLGSMRELVKDNFTGFTFPSDDPAGLSKIMERLAFDPNLSQKLGDNAFQYTLKNFNKSQYKKGLYKAFKKAQVI